jgi:hypothetical protein
MAFMAPPLENFSIDFLMPPARQEADGLFSGVWKDAFPS